MLLLNQELLLDNLKSYIYPHEETFQKFLRRLAEQVQIRQTDNRIVTLFPDSRDGSITRFHKLRDPIFFDLSFLTNEEIFPQVSPESADFFVVPTFNDSNQLQPQTRLPNPPPQAAMLDLIATLPFYTPETASKHIFFFYGDSYEPPECITNSHAYMVSAHRNNPWQAMPYHHESFGRP